VFAGRYPVAGTEARPLADLLPAHLGGLSNRFRLRTPNEPDPASMPSGSVNLPAAPAA
jgi:hypothetical protein